MLALLRQRNFALLWLGGLISFFGDWLMFIALPVFVYDMTGSTLATGAMLIAQTLPRLLFSSIAGVFVDRWDRRLTMIIANVLCAATLLLFLLVHSAEQLWLVYLAAFLQTTFTLFFQPAESALVPQLVGEEQLVPANGLLSINWEIMRLIAPPLGGLLMGVLGIWSVIILDSMSFVFSAAMIMLIVAPNLRAVRPAASPAQSGAVRAVARELLEGIQLVRNSPVVAAIFIIVAVAMVSEGIINVLGFPWLKQVLHGDALQRGWLASAQAVGGLIGGMLVGRVTRVLPPAKLIGFSGIMLGLVSLLMFNIASLPIDQSLWLPAALVLKALQGLPIIGVFVSIDVLLQQHVADRYRGRIFGAYSAIIALTTLLGQVAASLLGDQIGIVPVMNWSGLMYILAGVCGFLLLRRTTDVRPVPVSEVVVG